MMAVKVYSTTMSASLFGFDRFRDDQGVVYLVRAMRVCPRVGLIDIRGNVLSSKRREIVASFLAGAVLYQVCVDTWFCTVRNGGLEWVFNAEVMPEIERVWREVAG